MKDCISVAQTAKLVRKALGKHFSGIKFSVRSRSYAGGASIDVDWIDGPAAKAVDEIIHVFSGKGFDGMIDLAYYKTHWLLPDGSVVLAKSQGTEDSGGMHPRVENDKPHPDARMVSFGSGYIFTRRGMSAGFLRRAADKFAERTGLEPPETVEQSYWVHGKKTARATAHYKADYSRQEIIDRFTRFARETDERELDEKAVAPIQGYCPMPHATPKKFDCAANHYAAIVAAL